MKHPAQLLRNPIFVVSCLLFWINLILEKGFNIFIPWVNSYLDDLLCMPVLLTLSLFLLNMAYRTLFVWGFKPWYIVLAVIQISIIFEIILPAISATYISDPWDVLAYATGAWVHYQWINPEARLVMVAEKG